MNTPVIQSKTAEELPAYFLAGHMAPKGTYRELQSGREHRLKEEGTLPATCDGRVAVYVRELRTWAEMAGNTPNLENVEAAAL